MSKIRIHRAIPVLGVSARHCRRLAKRVLGGENVDPDGAVSIVWVDDTRMTELNRQFFDKNRPTDVIAFNLEEDVWGEVYVSVDTAARQAREYGVSLKNEMSRLMIHGILHLAGYEDASESEKETMTQKENDYLNALKVK